MFQIQHYINGEFRAPLSGTYIDHYNPATGQVYLLIPDADAADVELAVQAAKQAFPAWSNTSAEKRGKMLVKSANLIDHNLEKFAKAESIDNGKPIKLARTVDIPRASSNMEFFGTAIQHFSSESHYMEGTAINYTLRRPYGVAGCISPWNLPLYLFTWKIAPALAAGNCVIAKPSEITPMTAHLLGEICTEAGLPAGVLAILHGRGGGIGRALVALAKVKAISFTGGTTTGAAIASEVAASFKKLSLEMGGKNPTLVFADCEYETTIA